MCFGGLIKVLWHDGQGMCPLAKRLERGRFVWPRTEGEAVTITAAQPGYLLEGIDWRLPQRTERPQVAGSCNGAVRHGRLGGRMTVASAWDGAANGAVTTPAAEPLPDDIETLKAMLLAERQAYGAKVRD